ncbi:MAG: hypothetical protein RTU30_04150 [Candidatus Thorarchaeota archaeon]
MNLTWNYSVRSAMIVCIAVVILSISISCISAGFTPNLLNPTLTESSRNSFWSSEEKSDWQVTALQDEIIPIHNSTWGMIGNVETCMNIDVAPDGSVYAVGSSLDQDAGFAPSLVLLKWNTDAEVEWVQYWNESETSQGYGVCVHNNRVYTVGVHMGDDGQADTVLLAWNFDGFLMWSQTLDVGGSDGGIEVVIGSDGSIYVFGIAQRIISGDYEISSYLVKLTYNGELIWTKWNEVTGSYFSLTMSIAYSSDDYIYGQDSAGIRKWDTSGNIIWELEGQFVDMSLSSTGDIYAIGMKFSQEVYLTLSYHFLKISRNGNVLFNQTRGTGSANFNDFNYYMDLCTSYDGVTYALVESANQTLEPRLLKFDTEGEVVWNRTTAGLENLYTGYESNIKIQSSLNGRIYLGASKSSLYSYDRDFLLQIYIDPDYQDDNGSPSFGLVEFVIYGAAIGLILIVVIDFVRNKRKP